MFFDLDGTVLDSEPDFTFIINRMLAEQKRLPVTPDQVRLTISNGAKALLGLVYDVREGDPGHEQHLALFLDQYAEKIRHTEARLFPAMAQLLHELKSRKVPWGIVTNKSSRFTLPLMENIAPLSDSAQTICADHVSESKPSPEGLLLGCRNLQCRPEDAIYVGDHPRDIEAGKRAGMLTIAAAWGYLPPDSPPESWGADHVVASPDDIGPLLFP